MLPILLLAACTAEPVAEVPTEPPADSFLDGLAADYPVTLSPLADGVWVHTTNYTLPGQSPISTNGLVVVDGEAVTLVDGAWGELATVALIRRVEEETGRPVTRMIVTHHHADRTQGVDAAERQGIEVFTHPDTPRLAAQAGWPVPNTSVAALSEPGSRTRVGKVEIAYPGPGHAPDNLVAWLPDSGILYGGCAVRGAGVTHLGNTADADLPTWRDSLAWMKATYPEAKTVVPGHGKGAGLSLLDATMGMIEAELGESAAADAD
ncbi:MAG: subclass B1 metallo-beta-lactamase [Litorimonas sp.]